MKRKLLFASVLALSLLGLISIGPDTPAADPGQTAEEPQPAETPESMEGPAIEPLDTFEPTEKLSADSAVSFPVDI